jgi:hypothetical protein
MPNDTDAYPEDSFDNMKTFAARVHVPLRYRHDPGSGTRLRRSVHARFLRLNERDELQYRGRLDASRMTPVPNARRDLFEAMKQVADTGHGPKEQVPSMGCSIKCKH